MADHIDVDAVLVVRCKDCKHGAMFVIEDRVPFFACYKDKPDIKPVKRDWFCTDGVKKDKTGGNNETV